MYVSLVLSTVVHHKYSNTETESLKLVCCRDLGPTLSIWHTCQLRSTDTLKVLTALNYRINTILMTISGTWLISIHGDSERTLCP
jgi:hypothetical protein